MPIRSPWTSRVNQARYRRGVAAAMAGVVISTGLAACGSSPTAQLSSSAPADPNATVRVAWSTLPTQLDPAKATAEPVDFRVMNLVYDRLLSISPTGEITPAVATKWEYAPDGLSLTLTLREDVDFHDGTPLDAAAVVANLERVLSLGNRVAARLENVAGVVATGPYEVRLDLRAPTTEVPAMLAQIPGFIINPNLLRDGDLSTTTDGSGPYVIENFNSGTSVTLVRADDVSDYWDPDAAQAARFEYTRIPDPRALVNALRSGQIDAAQLAQPEQAEDLRSEIDRGNLMITPIKQESGLMVYLNRRVGPLADLDVRQAINHALDRETLVETFFPGSEPTVQQFHNLTKVYDENTADRYAYDPSKARELLAAAGYTDGIDLGTILVSNAVSTAFAESVQAMLAESGIRTTLQIMDSGQIFAEYANGAAPMMLNFASGYGSPAATLEYRVGAASNPAGSTPEFDALLSEANDNRLSNDQQIEGFRRASNYLVDEAWYAPIVWVSYPWVHTPALRGLSMEEMNFASTLGPYDWRYVGLATSESGS